MRKSVWRAFAALAAAGFIASVASVAMADAVPGTLTHQGRLFDKTGKPITDTVSITFNFYDAPNDNVPKVSETLDVTLSVEACDADLAQRYGGINRAFAALNDGAAPSTLYQEADIPHKVVPHLIGG